MVRKKANTFTMETDTPPWYVSTYYWVSQMSWKTERVRMFSN